MNGVGSYHNRCRLCISEAKLSLELFETEAIRLDLVNKIRSYISINVSLHDGLPQHICYECLSRIEMFHSYKQSCLEAQHTLKHWNLFCDGGSETVIDEFEDREESVESASSDMLLKNNACMNSIYKSSPDPHQVLPRTSKEFEHGGNPVVHSDIEENVVDSVAKVIDSANKHELIRKVSGTRNSRPLSSRSSSCKKRSSKTCIYSRGRSNNLHLRQNSETCVQHDEEQKTTSEHLPIKRSPSLISLVENPIETNSYPEEVFPNSVTKQCNSDNHISAFMDDENIDITAWLTEQDKNIRAPKNVEDDAQKHVNYLEKNVSTNIAKDMDTSTQALLQILESDEESVSFQSDVENSQVENIPTGILRTTATPRRKRRKIDSTDSKAAYVKSERLDKERNTKLRVRSESELKATSSHVRKSPRPAGQKVKVQSNQYRLMKPVTDEATGKLRYKCLKCGSLLSHKHYVKEHMKIHTGDKSFVCSLCHRAFRNNYMLKSHMAVHVSVKNFECGLCGHRFVGKERLKQHLKIHTSNPFVCPVCGRKCNQKQSLQRHMRVHTGERPYKCEFCDSAFADRTTWVNHRRIHTGERPFKCKVCNKTFSRTVNLQAHKKSHSNVRPFGCQLCNNKFKTKAHLVKHLSCVHKDLMKSVVSFMKEEKHPQ